MTTTGSSQSESGEMIEEKTAGVGVLVDINYRERNFSQISAPGAGSSRPHFSQDRYIAELLAKRKEEKLQEENLAAEAAVFVASKERSAIMKKAATLKIHVVPPTLPRKEFVEGKGKGKVKEMTKLEQKVQFHLDQAMARQAKMFINEERLREMLGEETVEEDELAWAIHEQEIKDELLARQLREEEAAKAEREKAEAEKEKAEKFKTEVKKLESKRKLPLRYHPREINEKQIFMEYLKSTGKYSGKQLGPMKFENIKDLYYKERKASADEDEIQDISKEEFEESLKKLKSESDSKKVTVDVPRYEAEQRVKARWDREEQVRLKKMEKEQIREQKRIESEEKKKRKKSLITRTSSRVEARKKRKLDSETTAAESTDHSTAHPQLQPEVIAEEDVVDVDPLSSEVPIVNWYSTEWEKKLAYKIEKADGSFMFYKRIKRIFSELTMTELAQMYQVGMGLQRTANRLDMNGILFRHLQMMFEPDLFAADIAIIEDVKSWEVFGKSGVYCIQFKSDTQYFLVEKEYKHNLNVMKMLLKKTLTQLLVTEYAELLITKITRQIENLKKRRRDD